MQIKPAEFLTLFPNFDTVDTHIIESKLIFAETVYCPNETLWGDKRKLGIMYATAHLLAMEWLQAAQIAGEASAIAEGGSSRGLTPNENDFQLTHYGRQYLQLANTIFVPSIIV